jgi:tetratricopeptide (TPR) repeat protein
VIYSINRHSIDWHRGMLLCGALSFWLFGGMAASGGAIAQVPELPTPPTAVETTGLQPSLLSQAQTALREERYPEAELLWRELANQWPDSAEMAYSLGMTLHRQFKIEEAAQAYVTATVLNPDHREAHINLSLALIQLASWMKPWCPSIRSSPCPIALPHLRASMLWPTTTGQWSWAAKANWKKHAKLWMKLWPLHPTSWKPRS